GKCLEATTHVHKELVDSVTGKAIIVGPSPSPIERINKQYRFQILLKYKSEPNLLDVLHKINEYYNERYKKDKLSLKIDVRSEEHTSELQSRFDLVCRLLLEKKKNVERRRKIQN